MAKTSKQNREIKRLLQQITNKRARIVIEHILAHGHVTTEELEKNMAITIRHGQRVTCASLESHWKHSESKIRQDGQLPRTALAM